jgi:TonB family protein
MTDFPAGTFEFPPAATTHTVHTCKQFIRSTAIDTPQPPIGPGPGVVDVVLRGLIDGEGHVLNLSVLESTRPDLNRTALDLVAKWTYQPARCDGNTAWWMSTFRVQFKGY